MLDRGEIVRLPHGRGNGVVIDCSTDGAVRVHVGVRPIGPVLARATNLEPIVEEYIECELVPTGRRVAVAQLTARRRITYAPRFANAESGD